MNIWKIVEKSTSTEGAFSANRTVCVNVKYGLAYAHSMITFRSDVPLKEHSLRVFRTFLIHVKEGTVDWDYDSLQQEDS